MSLGRPRSVTQPGNGPLTSPPAGGRLRQAFSCSFPDSVTEKAWAAWKVPRSAGSPGWFSLTPLLQQRPPFKYTSVRGGGEQGCAWGHGAQNKPHLLAVGTEEVLGAGTSSAKESGDGGLKSRCCLMEVGLAMVPGPP